MLEQLGTSDLTNRTATTEMSGYVNTRPWKLSAVFPPTLPPLS